MSENHDRIKILICCHKPYPVPKGDIFLPIHCGKALSNLDLGMIGDDTGDNISAKNGSYCELTAMYWAWKNLKTIYPGVEYVGLCHYRRYFDLSGDENGESVKNIDFLPQMENYREVILHEMAEHEIIVHYPYEFKNSYSLPVSIKAIFETHWGYKVWQTLKSKLHELYPEYDSLFTETQENGTQFYDYNMFICAWPLFVEYCEWLFPLLAELEKEVDLSPYNAYDRRFFGFVSEFLFIAYTRYRKLNVCCRPLFFIDLTTKMQKVFKKLRYRTERLRIIGRALLEIFVGGKCADKIISLFKKHKE
ncbi:MAG: DUF4422 domain-containing protein [Treponematales bacterium]